MDRGICEFLKIIAFLTFSLHINDGKLVGLDSKNADL